MSDAMQLLKTRRIVRLRRQLRALSILAVIIVCLTVVGAIACQFHPASSEHEQEAPIGHHQDGHSDGVPCLNAILPEDFVLVELAFASWVTMPVRLHATTFASPPFIPPQ
jgi:hypothetical protein